jgi:tetratricopeptide (TPR) repeat protein
MDSGRLDEALRDLRRAQSIYRTHFDRESPASGMMLGALGLCHQRRGDYDAALIDLERALSILESAYGPVHPMVLTAKSNHALSLIAKGRYEEARAECQQALDETRRAESPPSEDIPQLEEVVARALDRLGRPAEALELHERALAASPPGGLHLSGALNGLGLWHLQARRFAEALALFRRAHAVVEQKGGLPDAAANLGLGRALLGLGDRGAARTHLELGLSVIGSSLVLPDEIAGGRLALAQILWDEPAERPRALRLAAAARDAYAQLRLDHPRAAARRWLAAAHRSPQAR